MSFSFVTLKQLTEDVVNWSRQLPHYDCIVGVPRSGFIPASILATTRNTRLISAEELIQNGDEAINRAILRESNPLIRYSTPHGNKVLVVDDTTSDNSYTMEAIRSRLNTTLDITYGAVYRASAASKVDVWYKEIPQLRMFEWNWRRHWQLKNSLFDIDGVLCEDWEGPPEKEDDPDFLQHIKTVKPLYLPQVPIRTIVTSRSEKYRLETVNWLSEHNVRYKNLIMYPPVPPEERRRMGDHADRKAAAYLAEPEAPLFVESNVKQAKRIHEITKRPVLCIDNMTAYSE